MTYEQRRKAEEKERAAAEAKAKKGESPSTSDEAVKLLKEELEKLRQENKDLRADLKSAKKEEAEAKKTTTAVAPETATAAQVQKVSQKVDQLSNALDAFLSKQKDKTPPSNPTIQTFRKMPAWPDERFPGGYRPLTIKEAEVYNKAFPGKVKSLVAAVKIDAYDTEPEFVRWAKDEEAVIAILNMH